MMLLLSKQDLIEDAERMLLSEEEKFFDCYISNFSLGNKTEMLLFKIKQWDVIKHYVSFHPLSPDAQLILLTCDNIDMIKFYINRHELGLLAQLYLLETRNMELLRLHVEKHGLCSLIRIADTGDTELIEVCTKKD